MRIAILKKLLLIITVILLVFPKNIFSQNRPKVGLVLAGGGAKGFAHIEILKMLDSLNFPVDYIAGTSMGGIVGGFYAIGYSGEEIEEIILSLNWTELFNDKPERKEIPYLVKKYDAHFQTSVEIKGISPQAPTGFIAGQKIIQTFAKYTNPVSSIDDFDKFPIPYRCVAVDLISGRPITIKSGYLALAMRATMSIPSAFAPVEWGDYLFVDGGIMNNLPVDVAKEMGADFIIAVNVGSPKLKREEINSALDVLMQSFFLPGYIKEEKNIELSDIVITPDITAFGTGDFSDEATQEILAVGKVSAESFKDSLALIMKRWGLSPGRKDQRSGTEKLDVKDHHKITDIVTLKNNLLSREAIIELAKIDTGMIIEDADEKTFNRNLMDSGLFLLTNIHYASTSDSTVTAYIEVVEKLKPVIQRIEIHGNKTHPFRFIYNLLRVSPGETLEMDKINNRINKIYGLGYFRTIYYTIEPVANQRVVLHIWVQEKEHKQLYLGFKYLQEYKLVGSLGLLYNNMFFNGLRNSIMVDFAGITRFDYHLSYPSMGLDYPVYPFVRVHYKGISQKIYTELKDPVAAYKFEHFSYGMGLGFLFGNSTNIEFELAHEDFEYRPSIALPDWPSGEEHVTMVFGKLEYDNLDNGLVPNSGLLLNAYYEGQFYNNIGKGIKYNKAEVMGDIYLPIGSKQNLHLTGYYANSKGVIPFSRYFASMIPMNFFGMDFFKLRYTRLTMLGAEYRYQLFNDLYITFTGNGGFGLQSPVFTVDNKPIIGYGFGVSYNSVLGIITYKLGTSESTPYQPGQHEFWSTFYIGFPI